MRRTTLAELVSRRRMPDGLASARTDDAGFTPASAFSKRQEHRAKNPASAFRRSDPVLKRRLPHSHSGILRAGASRTPADSTKNGRGDRIRTCDPLVPNQMRYQAAPLPDAGDPLGGIAARGKPLIFAASDSSGCAEPYARGAAPAGTAPLSCRRANPTARSLLLGRGRGVRRFGADRVGRIVQAV